MFKELKVLELASVLAGPAVGQFFAELGATVIKVENLKTNGDVTRSWKTFGEETDDRSAYFTAVNWGKKSIYINLEEPEGKKIVHALAKQSDIIIASYKPGDAVRLGVDYESLKKINARLIYGQITGYGADDQRVGYDAVIQAESGFMYMNGEPGRPSMKMPVALIDVLAAHHLKEGILLALLRQSKTGNGDFIEVSLIQAAIASLANQATNWLVGGKIPQKKGSAHPNIAPYGDVFVTASGDEILLAIGTDRQFKQLCSLLRMQDMANDSKFSTNSARVQNRIVLHLKLESVIREFKTADIIGLLQKHNIPAGIIQNLAQVFQMGHAQEILIKSGQLAGVRTYVGTPNQSLGPHFSPPPTGGQHTIEILSGELEMDGKTIQELIFKGIIR